MTKLLQNIWLKLLALLVGVLVWFHVVTEKHYTYEVKLPISHVDLRVGLTLASLPPDSMLVQVSAKGKQLVQGAWRANGIRVNISKLPAGKHTVSLTPENTSLYYQRKSVVLEEVLSPAQFEVEIDTKVTQELPVTPQIVASPDEGFAVSRRMEISPARVKLTGPQSIVRSLTSLATEPRELSGLRNSIAVTAAVKTPGGYGMVVEPESVAVRLDVVPVKTRVYENMPVAVYHVPAQFAVRTNPAVVRVELTGPPEDIELLNRNALTIAADYRTMTPSGMAAISVDCPASFQVKNVSTDSVRILATPHARSRN